MKEHLGELDILRFSAALAVLFFHFAFRGAAAEGLSPLYYEPLASVFKYGYMGVYLFFMISGFVIMLSAQSAPLAKFVIARIARLYPAFWICCSITFAVIVLSGATLFPSTWRDYAANLTMMPMSLSSEFLDGSYWTLGVELKFYILVACVLAVGQIRNAERIVIAWVAIAVITNFYPMPWLHARLILKFAPYFAAGALFYFMRKNGPSPARLIALATCWLLALDRSVNALAEQAAHYRVEYSIVVVCIATTAFFAVFTAIALRRTGPLAQMRWPLLGMLTYPLYLLHQTIGYIVIGKLYGHVNDHLLFWGTVAASLGAAYVIAVYCEPPLMRVMKEAMGKVSARLPTLPVWKRS